MKIFQNLGDINLGKTNLGKNDLHPLKGCSPNFDLYYMFKLKVFVVDSQRRFSLMKFQAALSPLQSVLVAYSSNTLSSDKARHSLSVLLGACVMQKG